MAVEAIHKFAPHRTISLRGFDRRGCAASINNASASGFTVSGVFSDLADFVVLVLFDADDNFGHLTTTKYLPDFNLTGVVVDFDLSITNGMFPGSLKFPSVPWGSLSWINSSGTPGTTALNITSTTGEVAAGASFTVGGTPTNFDRIQLVYLGNVVVDTGTSITTGMSLATVAASMATAINGLTSSSVPLTATSSGANFTVTCTQPGVDGNSIELLTMYKTSGNTTLVPAGTATPSSGLTAKLTGGVDPTSLHIKLDFSVISTSLRQCWLTLAPSLPTDSGTVNPALVPFAAKEFSYVFSGWTITDPSSHTPLKIAGPGSVIASSRDSAVTFAGSGWSEQAGFYFGGFAHTSAHSGDSATIKYPCQYAHDLYLGTVLDGGNGTLNVTVDGVSQPALNTGAGGFSSPLTARRLLASGLTAGTHTVVLTLASGSPCWFDYLQAAVSSDLQDPSVTYPDAGAALDFDTDQTYKIPPARALSILQRLGFQADVDFYAGVFFALKRVRSGGSFHQCTVTLSGAPGIGNSFGSGSDTLFITLGGSTTGGTTVSGATTTGGTTTGGTSLGVAAYPADTITTVAQRIVNAINATFVGICAAPTTTAGQFTITVLSPINGFTLNVAYTTTTGSTVTMTVTGDIGMTGGQGGQEGVWEVDSTQTSPLNRAFADYLADFCAAVKAASLTVTVAFSQELLAPPDANTSAGAWSQRFADGTTVLTNTAFGSWGAGFVEAISVASGVATITQTAHGYITGNTAHFASGTGSGEWAVAVVDANHYTFVVAAAIANSGSYTPSAGDSVFIDLQTSQCAFNPSTVTPYLANCYKQAAGIMNAAALTPWLQFGEILHWFFSERMSQPVGFASWTAPISIGTPAPHGFVTGQTAIIAGVKGNTAANGTWPIIVVDATHFTLTGSNGNGNYVSATGTASGGGMAYYDANQAAAALTALGRALASFYTQDDDPTINSSADANFLAARIKTHCDTIRATVLATYSGAKFELLWPYDVNFASCYYTADVPFPQGGRLNRAVNLPATWATKSGSGMDRFKSEGLSWGATYRNLANAIATVRFPYQTLSWSKADTRYLVPWFNGGCPWGLEYLFTLNEGTPQINFWAVDHTVLLSQRVPLPVNVATIAAG